MTKFIGEKWWAGAYVISGISEYGSTQNNNETIFVMSSDTTVYALDALDGTVLWTIPPSPPTSKATPEHTTGRRRRSSR